jgi:hypothetical protein
MSGDLANVRIAQRFVDDCLDFLTKLRAGDERFALALEAYRQASKLRDLFEGRIIKAVEGE